MVAILLLVVGRRLSLLVLCGCAAVHCVCVISPLGRVGVTAVVPSLDLSLAVRAVAAAAPAQKTRCGIDVSQPKERPILLGRTKDKEFIATSRTSFSSAYKQIPLPSYKMAHQQQQSQSGVPAIQDEAIIVVLGASGDLAKKKTYPALFNLFRLDLLPKNTRIIGYARTKMDQKQFHEKIQDFLKAEKDEDKKAKGDFLKLCTYTPGAYDQDEAFQNLNTEMEKLESEHNIKQTNRLFYMALPPNVFTVVAAGLKKNCYSQKGNNRIVIEKPFGKDLQSSEEMMGELKKLWKEEETFRIDHYLGKEMVKNLLLLRFSNPFVETGLNNQMVDNVQITFKEPFGTEGRGGYFDEFGIIRDIQQNHLCQVLSLLAMERPVSFSSEDIRNEKVKVLKYVPEIKQEDVLIGQYAAANGKPGYKDDDTVPKDSNCPTFAALTMWVNSPRWQGVPFVLKAGKALDEAKVEIRVQYKDVTKGIFKDIPRNELVIRIQPNEAVYLKINAKKPGLQLESISTELDLTYKERLEDYRIPEAYEALIQDAMNGDHSNFVRDDELHESWRVFTPILHAIDNGQIKNEEYPYGSRGPQSLNHFIAKYGYRRDNENYSWPKTNVQRVPGKM